MRSGSLKVQESVLCEPFEPDSLLFEVNGIVFLEFSTKESN